MARENIRWAHIQSAHVLDKVACPAVAQLQPVIAHLATLTDDVIVDIGDILHVTHRISQIFPVADQHVKAQISKGMAEMSRVIRRDAANIDGCRIAQRGKRFQSAALVVV